MIFISIDIGGIYYTTTLVFYIVQRSPRGERTSKYLFIYIAPYWPYGRPQRSYGRCATSGWAG